ncbi:flavin reductase family protein [Shouchella patagoniensis]|uniref:flavin reductase family protein n=1 Tax=Shouchella patagoniensis TaxID=228576 RepID=UPI000995A655|nr:flavin reductase family protein [Shouchella patagoniensis]
MDERLFRTAMSKFTTGVTVITTEVDGDIHGMTANAFMSVSLDPKLVLISVGNRAKMKGYIDLSSTFAVNLLSRSQENVSKQFAGQINDKNTAVFTEFSGLPVIDKALASIACDVHDTTIQGDHTLYIGKVRDVVVTDAEPLTFYSGNYGMIS